MISMMVVFLLLISFQFKHWLCDYPLQTSYMLQKCQRKGWFLPLMAHSAVHGVGTVLITVWFIGYWAILLGLFDLVIHFVVDRVKANPDIGGRFSVDEPQFWWTLGADQMAHHLTHYAIIFTVLAIA